MDPSIDPATIQDRSGNGHIAAAIFARGGGGTEVLAGVIAPNRRARLVAVAAAVVIAIV